jgi:uncharacterized protein DUF3987
MPPEDQPEGPGSSHARCSAGGTRLYVHGELDGPELRLFDQRIRELLELALPVIGSDMILEPPVLYLSPDARDLWIEFHNKIELEIGKLGKHHLVADFASKSAEQSRPHRRCSACI